MYSFIIGVSLFCIALLCHLIIWRFHIPKNPIMALLLIFYCILFSGIILLWYYQIGLTIFVNNSLYTNLSILLFYTAMSFAYCFTYVGLNDDSPSLIIIMSIFNAGKKGLRKTELSHFINDDVFIKPRLEFLIKEKMVYKVGDKHKIAPKGLKLLSIFIFIQKLMKLPLKSG